MFLGMSLSKYQMWLLLLAALIQSMVQAHDPSSDEID